MNSLRVFTDEEARAAKILLAAKVASMMGRKFEEGDWSDVYCKAKGLPDEGWSNLRIDVNFNGLGVEFKMLRISRLSGKNIKNVCGTSQMHPSATRSIRIGNLELDANEVMADVLGQYATWMEDRTQKVRDKSPDGTANMRFGWLLWEESLREFLYFEEEMTKPNANNFYAEWNVTEARGARKASKSLWIYDKKSNKKKYSVTTSAGIKIQPYFDVPPPNDPNMAYFRVQSEQLDEDTIVLWIATATAVMLKSRLGSLEKDVVSQAVLDAVKVHRSDNELAGEGLNAAVPVCVSKEAFDLLIEHWEAVSDDHRIQLLLRALN